MIFLSLGAFPLLKRTGRLKKSPDPDYLSLFYTGVITVVSIKIAPIQTSISKIQIRLVVCKNQHRAVSLTIDNPTDLVKGGSISSMSANQIQTKT